MQSEQRQETKQSTMADFDPSRDIIIVHLHSQTIMPIVICICHVKMWRHPENRKYTTLVSWKLTHGHVQVTC